MKIGIPDSVRQQTTKCPHGLECLENGHCGNREICKVSYPYGTNVLRLAYGDQFVCPYRIGFGNGQLCTCPVRYYLHTKGRRSIG